MISQNYIYIYSSFAISFVVSLTIYISFFFESFSVFVFRIEMEIETDRKREWEWKRERGREVYGNSRSKRLIDRLLNGSQKARGSINPRNRTEIKQVFFCLTIMKKKRERRLIIFSCFKYSGNTCKIWLASKMVKRWNNHSRSQHRSSVRSTLPETEASSIEWSMLLNLDYIKIYTLHTHRHTLWLWIVSCFNNLFET